MRLTLDILKTMNDFDFVVEVTGDYTGTLTGRGASHEPKELVPPPNINLLCIAILSNFGYHGALTFSRTVPFS